MKRVACYLGKTPTGGLACAVAAVLNNIFAAGATDLTGVELLERIAPHDVPGIQARIVNAQRRAVIDAGQYPDVLNRPAFENPAEMDFSVPFVLGAIVEVPNSFHAPATDQPAVETHLIGPVRGRPGGM